MLSRTFLFSGHFGSSVDSLDPLAALGLILGCLFFRMEHALAAMMEAAGEAARESAPADSHVTCRSRRKF